MYKAENKKSIFNSEFNNKKLPGVDIAKFFFSICIIALHTKVVGTDNKEKWVSSRRWIIMSLFIAPALFCVVAEIKIDERRWLYMSSALSRKLSVGMYFLHRPILWIVSNISNDEMMNFTLTTAICVSICLLSYRKPNSFLCKMLQ